MDSLPAVNYPLSNWSVASWKTRPAAHQAAYEDEGALERALARLRSLPPLVTSWEIERLRSLVADAEDGRRFLLWGGDCAETLDDCRPESVASKLKILLQMSLVLVHGAKRPVVRIGRFAGQYAKPRTSPTETRADASGATVTLPSYFGDLINRAEFTRAARTPDPELLVRCHQHAAMTLNFIRALVAGGFADLHHPEYWDLGFLQHAGLPRALRDEYQLMTTQLAEALRFMEALGEISIDEITRVEFFTSHEGLSLAYESAHTREVPRRPGLFYNLSTHLPWIGDRTRALTGAHVEFFRGLRNPVGVKLGPDVGAEEVLDLCHRLNPLNEPGRLVLVARMGAKRVAQRLPELVRAVRSAGRRAVWVCDPMHGNGAVASTGVKTRSFDDILAEIEASFAIHTQEGAQLGGVHFELTGEDVTECVGGASGVTEQDLSRNYASLCDPRLNYQQSLELALRIARLMRA